MEDKTDKYIKDILKDLKSESPSNDFTQVVMSQIITEEKLVQDTKVSFFKKYKFILIFTFIFTVIYIIVFFFADSQESTFLVKINFKPDELSIFDKIKEFFNVSIRFSSIHLIIIASVLILFFIDYFIPKISKAKHLTI